MAAIGLHPRRELLEDVIRRSVARAGDKGISVAHRETGAMREPVVKGLAEIVEGVHAVGPTDSSALRRAQVWAPLAKRASELPNVAFVTPFVDAELQDRGLLGPLSAIAVSVFACEMSEGRTRGGVGGKRTGLLAMGIDARGAVRPAGWAAIGKRDSVQEDGRMPDSGENVLISLLSALGTAHPDVPMFVEGLLWPTLVEGRVEYVTRFGDAATIERTRSLPVVFRIAPPDRTVHFTASTIESPMPLRMRTTGHRRILELRSYLGRPSYFATADKTRVELSIAAIMSVEDARAEITRAGDQLRDSAVLTGNVQAEEAMAVRVTGHQLHSIFELAGLQ
jgi:hypothetical protein